MSLDDHPTVRAVRARSSQPVYDAPVSSDLLKRIARECGADDVGIIEFDRAAIAPQRDFIRKVYGRTRSLLAIACHMNREPVRSPSRSVANEEFHSTYDHVNETARASFARSTSTVSRPAIQSPLSRWRWTCRGS